MLTAESQENARLRRVIQEQQDLISSLRGEIRDLRESYISPTVLGNLISDRIKQGKVKLPEELGSVSSGTSVSVERIKVWDSLTSPCEVVVFDLWVENERGKQLYIGSLSVKVVRCL